MWPIRSSALESSCYKRVSSLNLDWGHFIMIPIALWMDLKYPLCCVMHFVEKRICPIVWDKYNVKTAYYCYDYNWVKSDDIRMVHRYFLWMQMRLRCEVEVNLMSQLCFLCDIRKRVELNSPHANYLLRICDANIRIVFAFAGSMNQALLYM